MSSTGSSTVFRGSACSLSSSMNRQPLDHLVNYFHPHWGLSNKRVIVLEFQPMNLFLVIQIKYLILSNERYQHSKMNLVLLMVNVVDKSK